MGEMDQQQVMERHRQNARNYELWRRKLVGRPVRDRVMAVLYRYPKGRQEREIADITGVSRRQVKGVIDSLVAQDMVAIEKISTATGKKKYFVLRPGIA